MEMMKIGKSDVQAPALVMGSFGMGGGTSWQDTTDDDNELVKVIQDAHEIGVVGIDTAPVYGLGRAENIIGKAIAGHRDEWYISTKCCMQWRNDDGKFMYTRDGKNVYKCFSYDGIIGDAKDCCERLGTDHIDTFIMHQCPELEDAEECMKALEDLRKQGVIRAIGISNCAMTVHPIEILKECLKYGQIDLVQECASLLSRQNLGEFNQVCLDNGVTFQNYSGLEKGALAGKFPAEATQKGDNRATYKWFTPDGKKAVLKLIDGLKPIAEKYGCSTSNLCLAWLRAQAPNINLLVGARKVASIQDTMKVLDIKLSDEDKEAITKLGDIANEENNVEWKPI